MSIRAILVEDNPTIRDTLIPTLRELANVEVVAIAENALDAVVASRHVSWDLMVLDMFLKDSSGLVVLNHLRDRGNKKIVVLTNYATEDIRARCMSLGADAVFDKSTEIDAFVDHCLAQSSVWGLLAPMPDASKLNP